MAVRRRDGTSDAVPKRRGLLRRRRKPVEEVTVTPVITPSASATVGPRVTTWAEDLAADRDDTPSAGEEASVRAPVSWMERERAEAERIHAEQKAAQEAEMTRLGAAPAPVSRPDPAAARRDEKARADEARAAETRSVEETRLAEEARREKAAPVTEEARRAEEERSADERARLAAPTGTALDVPDEVWLAGEAAEAARIERDRAAAQTAEEARLEAEEQAVDTPVSVADDGAEETRLAAELAEAQRIDTERRAAQMAEEARLANLATAPVHAQSAPAVRPEPVAQGSPARPGQDEVPSTVTRFVQFEPGSGLRYLLGTVFILASACAVLAVFWGIAEGSGRAFGLAAVAAILAALNWSALLNSTPNLVSIREGTLDVSHGPEVESFDLREPSTPLVMSGDTRSRSWKATLQTPSGHVITLTARDVDPAQFAELVGTYRALGPRGRTEG